MTTVLLGTFYGPESDSRLFFNAIFTRDSSPPPPLNNPFISDTNDSSIGVVLAGFALHSTRIIRVNVDGFKKSVTSDGHTANMGRQRPT